jgi:hypothetical protein
VATSGARPGHPAIVRLVACGRIAHRTLEAAPRGIVCAAFQRSCYVEFTDRRVICLGDSSIGCGPLNAHVDGFVPPRVGEVLVLSADGATIWPPFARDGRAGWAALDALRTVARERLPIEGLGGLVGSVSNPLIEHARPALDALDRWLDGGALDRDAEALIGLGPGLTPSGDDYLGGLLIALHTCGRSAQANALWAWLGARVPARTSLISAAHLAAAAEGEGHGLLHACLGALVEGKTTGWRERLDRLATLGHCSGWDGLAGVLAVMQRNTAEADPPLSRRRAID